MDLEAIHLSLQARFVDIERIARLNHSKVAKAFRKVQVASEHFNPSSGYGHDDLGRAKLDELFAAVFSTEAGLARATFASGTHAIACALLGNLAPGDRLIFALGKPYDTLMPLIDHLLKRLNVTVDVVEHQNWLDEEAVIHKVGMAVRPDTKIIAVQRSRGYSAERHSWSVGSIGRLIEFCKLQNPASICFVDNCYGEFVEAIEPTDVGADLMAGSLIKNPGGGIAIGGGYVVGRDSLVQGAAERLTCPGVGAEGGINFNCARDLFMGLYLAPQLVSNNLKGMVLFARAMEEIGLSTQPSWDAFRTDTIQRVDCFSADRLILLCQAVQSLSPVDSHLTVQPDYTPGYVDKVVMAGGTFIQGSTAELSVDGPLRPPYAAYLQGGLSYFYTYELLQSLLELTEFQQLHAGSRG